MGSKALAEEKQSGQKNEDLVAELRRQIQDVWQWERDLRHEVTQVIEEQKRQHKEAVSQLQAAAEDTALECRRQNEAQAMHRQWLEEQIARSHAWWHSKVRGLQEGDRQPHSEVLSGAPLQEPLLEAAAERLARSTILRAVSVATLAG